MSSFDINKSTGTVSGKNPFQDSYESAKAPAKNQFFYTEDEISKQRKVLDDLTRSGVDEGVLRIQRQRLQDMESKKQMPRNENEFNSSLDFLKENAPAFANGINTPQSDFVPMPMTPPAAGGSGVSVKPAASPEPVNAAAAMPMPDVSNDDQAKRDALAVQQKKEKLQSLFPQALAGFGDMVTAAGAPYGTKQTDALDKVVKIGNENQKEVKADLEKSFLTDPKSGASKIAQSAAARLLGKKPEDMAGLSLTQINGAFPLWKEALNNEQAMELKKMQLEAIKAQKEMAKSSKDDNFREKQIQQIRQNLTGSKGFQNMQSIDYNGRIIEDSLKNPNGYGDLGAMFAFMKALDPTSVVREGEQERFQSTASLPTSMVNTLNKWATGKTLQPEQRKQVAEFAGKMRQHAIEQYKMGAKPSIEQAKRLNYNLSEIDPLFEDAAASGGKKLAKKQYSKSANKTKLIYSDGTEEIVDGKQ